MLDIDIDLSWNYIFVLSLCNITWRNNDVRPFFTTKTEELINTSSTNSISRNLFARSEELINDRFRSNTDESLRQWWINENSLSTKVTVQFIFNLSKQVIETRKSKEQRTKIEHPRKFSRQKVLWNQRREYRSVLLLLLFKEGEDKSHVCVFYKCQVSLGNYNRIYRDVNSMFFFFTSMRKLSAM